MLKGFRDFILRGNVVDLAIAVVIGTAFTAIVTAFVMDVLTPLIAAIAGKPNFSNLYFTINKSHIEYGLFINALVSFLIIAAVVYFAVVLPVGKLLARKAATPEPDTKACPECLSDIPLAAIRCAFCTVEQVEA